jgi:hypothetical protein
LASDSTAGGGLRGAAGWGAGGDWGEAGVLRRLAQEPQLALDLDPPTSLMAKLEKKGSRFL